MALMAGSLHFLIQFISSQGPEFLSKIFWIFWSKKVCLVFLIVLLKLFQSSTCFKVLYFSSSLWKLLFHYAFECFVMLTTFESLNYILSISLANVCTICLRTSLLGIFSVLSYMMTPSGLNMFFHYCSINSEQGIIQW